MLETQTSVGVNPALVLPDTPILSFPEQTQILPTQTQIQVLPHLGVLTPRPTSGLGQ